MKNPKSRIHNSKLVSALACAALTLLILWLALIPAVSAPSGLGWDKLNHAGAIGVVTWLAYLSFQQRGRAAQAAFLYGIALGVLIELLQGSLATGRSAEWSDVAADLVGAGCVWGSINLLKRRKPAIRPGNGC
ncbi:MAG: hypothetical protein A2076_14520 [Geobacteraceae bacterium GWC2_53_11]|nr:MAG: hypothetical protein A2076_14520 [Geobacteraceae bacterium GWC2_53_11]